MKPPFWSIVVTILGLTTSLALGGCAKSEQQAGPSGGTRAPTVQVASGSREVVENYLKAASSADGAGMYALIASSERDDESPKTLGDTAHDRYSPATSWQILKVEENGSMSHVIVGFKGAKVEPNPYRFTLTREAGEWRIVQSPELHEEDKRDGIKIKL